LYNFQIQTLIIRPINITSPAGRQPSNIKTLKQHTIMTTIEELPLTPKQQRFCDEYFKDMNATAAATRAGYSRATALNGQLMQAPKIAAYIARRLGENAKRPLLDQHALLNELESVAFAKMGNYFDAKGNMKPVSELSEGERSAIWGISVTERKDGSKTTKIKLHNKLAAIEKIAKHLGLYNVEFMPEKKYVYVDKENLDAWDRLDDETMAVAEKKVAVAVAVEEDEETLAEREEALNTREQEVILREEYLNDREKKLREWEYRLERPGAVVDITPKPSVTSVSTTTAVTEKPVAKRVTKEKEWRLERGQNGGNRYVSGY
jgi:phage terminase small subunit